MESKSISNQTKLWLVLCYKDVPFWFLVIRRNLNFDIQIQVVLEKRRHLWSQKIGPRMRCNAVSTGENKLLVKSKSLLLSGEK